MRGMREFRKRWRLLLTLLLCVGALGAYIKFPVFASETASQETASSVKMDVTYGYNEAAKGDRYLPVRINLENLEDENFEGTIEILAAESSFEIYRYDYLVELGENEKKEVIYHIPLGVKSDQLYVTLKNNSGSQVVKKRLKINVSKEVAELMIGILSDNQGKLQYLDGIGINYGSLRTRTVPMDEEIFPEKSLGLDLFDIILITNYDSSKLSNEQKEAIRDWVNQGGILILGTGDRVRDVLGDVDFGLVETPYGEADMRSVDFGVEYAEKSPGDSFVELPCVDLTLNDGSDVMTSDQITLLSVAVHGSGKVAVAAYDFTDIAQFCQQQPSYVEKIMAAVLGENKIQELTQSNYFGYSNLYYSVLSLINTGSVDRLPNLPLYSVVIILYIILIGPVLFFILKWKEHRNWYMKGIIFISLCFTGIIYMMGAKTRFQSAFFSYATIEDVSDSQMCDYTYINVRTPYNNPYSVDISADYTIRPITKNFFYDMTSVPKFTGNEPYKVAVQERKEKTKLLMQNDVAFTPKLFSLTKKSGNTEKKGFTGDITVFNGQISGTITNHFPFAVENAALLMYGKVVSLGTLEAGETKDLSNRKILYYPVSYVYPVAQMISGADQFEKADITDNNYMVAQDRSNLLSFYMYNNLDGYTSEARVVAFSQEKDNTDFIADGEYVTDGITMLTSAIDINNTLDEYIYRTGFLKNPNIISGNYQQDYNYMYGLDPVILEYSLGNDLDVEKVLFDYISKEFIDKQKNSYMISYSGKISFYNYDTGYYDTMDTKKTSFDKEELKPYLSPSNNLTVKYVPENNEDYQMNIILPMISVIGREK